MLEVRNLVKRYGAATALADVSFSLDPGICAIVGPNGAGKTTLLRTVTGAERADSGSVSLDGMDVYASAPRIFRHIAYLSDQVPLYRDLTVEDHLLYRGRLKGLVPRRLRLHEQRAQFPCRIREGLDAEHCEMLAAALASTARHTLVLLATHRFDVLEKSGGTCLVLASGALAASFAFGGPVTSSNVGGVAASASLASRIADALRAHYASGMEIQA